MDWELDRRDITLCRQLGIGEFGPIYDAEVRLGLNMTSRAIVKVCVQHSQLMTLLHPPTHTSDLAHTHVQVSVYSSSIVRLL